MRRQHYWTDGLKTIPVSFFCCKYYLYFRNKSFQLLKMHFFGGLTEHRKRLQTFFFVNCFHGQIRNFGSLFPEICILACFIAASFLSLPHASNKIEQPFLRPKSTSINADHLYFHVWMTFTLFPVLGQFLFFQMYEKKCPLLEIIHHVICEELLDSE